MSFKTLAAASVLAAAQLVAGHAAIVAAVGDAGGSGMSIGIDPNTPRDGTQQNPFQLDATRFKGPNAATFGQTVGGGENDLESGTRAIMALTGDQLPQVRPGGTLDMTLHQVNGDGGGPYDCSVNADATGNNWSTIPVLLSPPGQNSRNRGGAMTDFPMKVQIPADTACTGNVAGQAAVCLVRCENAARAGPFGGIIPFQIAQPANTPAAARRNLARAIQETEKAYKRMAKRAIEAAEFEDEE